jgi:hypothetical protein
VLCCCVLSVRYVSVLWVCYAAVFLACVMWVFCECVMQLCSQRALCECYVCYAAVFSASVLWVCYGPMYLQWTLDRHTPLPDHFQRLWMKRNSSVTVCVLTGGCSDDMGSWFGMLISACVVLSIVAISKRVFALSDSCSCISKFDFLFIRQNVQIFSSIHEFAFFYVNLQSDSKLLLRFPFIGDGTPTII